MIETNTGRGADGADRSLAAGVHLGPYQLVQELAQGPWPEGVMSRYLGLHAEAQTSHVLYRLALAGDKSERRRVVSAFDALSHLSHPHVLRIERFTLEGDRAAWAVTPYTGAQSGLLTLPDHLSAKGGRMGLAEAERATRHVLEAMACGHERGIVNGPIDRERLLVDRFGSIRVELYGLDRMLDGLGSANAEVIRDEVRGAVELAYRLITGIDADEPMIPASRLAKKLDKRVSDWLEAGLDPAGGYSSAAEALEALSETMPRPVVGPVRQVLDRFRGRVAVRDAAGDGA